MATAGFFKRIFADLLDAFVIGFLVFLLSFIFGGIPELGVRIVEIILAFFYFPLLESSQWQCTLGQRCLNMYVSSTLHQRLSFGRAFLREIMKMFLALPLSIFITCELLLLFFFQSVFQLSGIVTALSLLFVLITAIAGALVLFYVRLFNNNQQTARDYLTQSMMMIVSEKS